MIWNEHLRQKGQHAFLGASKYHWINYDPEKIGLAYRNFLASARGTELHDFAARCIRLNQKLPRSMILPQDAFGLIRSFLEVKRLSIAMSMMQLVFA